MPVVPWSIARIIGGAARLIARVGPLRRAGLSRPGPPRVLPPPATVGQAIAGCLLGAFASGGESDGIQVRACGQPTGAAPRPTPTAGTRLARKSPTAATTAVEHEVRELAARWTKPRQSRPVARWARSSSTSTTRSPRGRRRSSCRSPSRTAARTAARGSSSPRSARWPEIGARARARSGAGSPSARSRARAEAAADALAKAATARSHSPRRTAPTSAGSCARRVAQVARRTRTNTGGCGVERQRQAPRRAASVAAPPLPMLRGAVTTSAPRGAARAPPCRRWSRRRPPSTRARETPRASAASVASMRSRLVVGGDDHDDGGGRPWRAAIVPARVQTASRRQRVPDIEAHITGTVWKIECEVGDESRTRATRS